MKTTIKCFSLTDWHGLKILIIHSIGDCVNRRVIWLWLINLKHAYPLALQISSKEFILIKNVINGTHMPI